MRELIKAPKFQDFSLFQWLGETPKRLVAEHIFAADKRAGEKFLKQIDDAVEDPIRSKTGD